METESTAVLPDSWDDVDVEKPGDLPERITPRDLELAVAENETLLEVTRSLRAGRAILRLALNRLDLADDLSTPNANALRATGGDDGE